MPAQPRWRLVGAFNDCKISAGSKVRIRDRYYNVWEGKVDAVYCTRTDLLCWRCTESLPTLRAKITTETNGTKRGRVEAYTI
jgi:hypothetical protein